MRACSLTGRVDFGNTSEGFGLTGAGRSSTLDFFPGVPAGDGGGGGFDASLDGSTDAVRGVVENRKRPDTRRGVPRGEDVYDIAKERVLELEYDLGQFKASRAVFVERLRAAVNDMLCFSMGKERRESCSMPDGLRAAPCQDTISAYQYNHPRQSALLLWEFTGRCWSL